MTPAPLSRRELLRTCTNGLGAVALAHLLRDDGLLRAAPAKPDFDRKTFDLAPKAAHAEPRAKAMISLFMQGGPSHIDLFDPKPALEPLHGKPFPGEVKYDNAAQASSKVMASPWKFSKRGEAGIEISELLPHTAGVIDDLCLIRSMKTDVNNHGQSIASLNSGRLAEGHPVLGSWLTYALGTAGRDLPAFVALTDPGGPPILANQNWTNGWLPSLYQGTLIRPREPRVANLDPPPHLKGEPQAAYLRYLDGLNREHLADRPAESDLEARIATYELAGRMQTAAKEALDLSGETAETRRLYGLDEPETAEYGARCLLARRLVERGVRFVQVFTQTQFWDHHNAIRAGLPASCRKTDKPAAALVTDLKRRGLLDSTLVFWGGEMGRLPVVQNDAGAENAGRDHNTYGFSAWLAGGGVKGGLAYGSTDEFGHKAAENPVSHHDFHATVLALFGLDHERLVYARNGRPFSLTDGKPCRVVTEIIA